MITNVGDAHIENLGGTVRGPCGPKCEIFDHLRPGGLAVLCGDDALLNGLDLPFETLRCGRSEHCNVRVTDIVRPGHRRPGLHRHHPRRSYRLSIPSPGDYMIYSASMAVAIGEYLGLSEQEIVEGVAEYVSTGSRMRRIRLRRTGSSSTTATTPIPRPWKRRWRFWRTPPAAAGWRCWATWGSWAHQPGRPPAGGPHHCPAGAGRGDRHRPQGRRHRPDCRSPAQHFAAIEEALPALRREFTPGTAVLVKASHAMEFGKIVSELEKM